MSAGSCEWTERREFNHGLHLHCVVHGGALSQDGARWIAVPPGFLFPVRALAQVFRAKFLAALHRAFTTGTLRFAGSLTHLAEPAAFAAWLADLRQHTCVVYAKRPFGGPTQVLDYLGRYTHRVAISNERLVSHTDGLVHFRWKDYADGARTKVMALAAEEFNRFRTARAQPRIPIVVRGRRFSPTGFIRHARRTTDKTLFVWADAECRRA